jgi:hypothetical protein
MVKVAFNQPENGVPVHFFVNRHQLATGDGLPAISDFQFRDLETTPQRSFEVKVIVDSKLCYQVPISVPK